MIKVFVVQCIIQFINFETNIVFNIDFKAF